MSVTLSRARTKNNPNPQPQANDGAPVSGQAKPQADSPDPIGDLDREEMLERFIDWFESSRDHYQPWRQESLSCYDFVAGTQWDDVDLQILSEQDRPAVTFNRVAPFVDAVSGLEIGNRQETIYLPRQVGSTGINELLTSAAKWARDECDAEDEESQAVKDNIICGVGVTQTRMDYDVDPDGMIRIDRVDPLEVYPDPASRKGNYADARFVMRVKDIPEATAKEMFPDYDVVDLHAAWAEDQAEDAQQPHNARIAPYYRIDQSDGLDRQRQQVRLVEVEWWDYVTAYRVLDPSTGRFVRLNEEDAGRYRLRARMLDQDAPMIKDRQRRYYKAIVGNVILNVMRGPDSGGFTYKFMTGKLDRNRGIWYGMVRAMRDPQLWANKFFTQSMHIVNVNAKGGLLAETDAFVDIEAARNNWSSADSITELNPGALQNGKVQQKEAPQFPPQLNAMLEMAINAIPSTAGVNLEMIAQQTKDQAGVLEMQRKQQGMTVLAYVFDAKRKYQKEQGRLMLWMIQTFIADGRLIRIGGPEEAQYVPLTHEPGLVEYDVIVDEAPSSPNQKERVWAMVMQMAPMLKQMALPPQAMMEMLKYSPFPASMIQKVGDIMANPPNPTPEQSAKVALDNAKAQESQAKAHSMMAESANAPQKAQLEAAGIQYDHQKLALEQQKIIADTEKSRAEAMNALQDSGAAANAQSFDQMMQAVDMLQSGHDAHQDRVLQAQQQLHEQGLAQQQHDLATQQHQHQVALGQAQMAMQAQGQQHEQGMAEQQHSLASQQAAQQAQQADKQHQLAKSTATGTQKLKAQEIKIKARAPATKPRRQ